MIGTYTFYNDFINCPHKAWHKHVLKDVPFEITPELEHGRKVHTALEDRINKGIDLDPDFLGHVNVVCEVFDSLSEVIPVRAEYFIGMRSDGTGCTWDDSKVWFRGKLDVAVMTPKVAWLIDWKTGKPREDPFELECQAMLLHATHPSIIELIGEYYWVKEKRFGKRYELNPVKAFERVMKLYNKVCQYENMMNWPKQSSPLCAWCPVKECENWKPRLK